MTLHMAGKIFMAAVGILMLETRFPRVHGDIGNGATCPFPVMLRSVRGESLHHSGSLVQKAG